MYAGQLIERKGLGPFLAVLAQWGENHPDRVIEFWLVGDGSLRGVLEETAMPANVSLRFVGKVSYIDLPRVYGQCGIFVFPTLADEWAVVVNEALASGLPVLGSLYSQAVEELVEDGVSGWTFRPDFPEEAYRALDRALSTPRDALDSMRANATNAVKEVTPAFAAESIAEAVRYVTARSPR
jgi:glycosyltransferase involved in cell wall biosynthesis